MRIALVGNPNAGKSTLFNLLAGAHQSTHNIPGTTVENQEGVYLTKDQVSIDLIDLPGQYSLLPFTSDEAVSTSVILGQDGEEPPDLIVFTLNTLNYSSSLYLLKQLLELKIPLIVAGTKIDLISQAGSNYDRIQFEQITQQPIFELNLRTHFGVSQLKTQIDQKLLELEAAPPAPPAIPADLEQWVKTNANREFRWVAQFDKPVDNDLVRHSRTSKIDRVLLNPIFGIPVFAVIMFLIFQLTTTITAPWIDFVEGVIGESLNNLIADTLGTEGWLVGLLSSGGVETIVTVLTFLGPMAMIFILMSTLEDSGYMARAAFIANAMMKKIGLDGRAFIPLMIGFGCNLPSYAATKAMPDEGKRKLIAYLVPFTLCSARMVVFVVLAYAVFAEYAAVAMFAMYMISILLIVGIGWIIRQSVPSYRKLSSANFIIDLPQYQFPQLFNMVKYVADKLKDFIFQAGKIIGLTLIAMWLLQSTPLPGSGASFGEVEDVHDSVYGAITDSIAVAFKPTGFGDWHFSSAIITGFIAKEVVVSSIAQSYNLDDPLENEDPVTTAKLGDEIRTTLENDAQGNVPAYVGGFALMFFFLAYTPCFATVAECKRVFGGWFALKSVILSVAVGYLGALLIFQIGSLFF